MGPKCLIDKANAAWGEENSVGILMNARVEEASHRDGIVEDEDLHARPNLMAALIVSPCGSGCSLRRSSMRAPARLRGELRPRTAGSEGTETALRIK